MYSSLFASFRSLPNITSKFDAAKMNAVRERQKQYTRQLDESAGDKISLQIDSVTRAVVQQFRKLINSERCALFLHDQRTNELYFKPVGGLDTKVQEIRWVGRWDERSESRRLLCLWLRLRCFNARTF